MKQKQMESKTFWKDGKLVTMYKQDLGGIFAGVDSWICQETLDRMMYQLRQDREERERKKEERERKKEPVKFFV